MTVKVIIAVAGGIVTISAALAIVRPLLISDPAPHAGIARVAPLESIPDQIKTICGALSWIERADLRGRIETNWRRVCQERTTGGDDSDYLSIIGDAQESYRAVNAGLEYDYTPPC